MNVSDDVLLQLKESALLLGISYNRCIHVVGDVMMLRLNEAAAMAAFYITDL